MMENKLDKLFRDQLSKHEEIPSAQAWDQIQHNLVNRKRGLWMRRLSIAASIMLIAAAGFVGYRMLKTVNNRSEIVKATNQIQDQVIIPKDEGEKGQVDINSEEVKSETNQIKPIEAKQTIIEQDDVPKVKEQKDMTAEATAVVKENKTAVDNVPMVEEHFEAELAMNGHQEKEEEVPAEIFEALADNNLEELTEVEKVIEGQATKNQKKSFPRVRIVYKANEDSELVTSGKRRILNNGINKLTEFSEEHILTADRKTKLRNTKDDLLALNFGKLLNKSNSNVEN